MKNMTPKEAWALLQSNPQALLIDVRMEIESLYVGRPPHSVNLPWYEYPELTHEPHVFCKAVEAEAGSKARPLVLLCRSGTRSLDAARALEREGFSNVCNVLHGFEGDRDEAHHRSRLNGWRFDGLPWEQM